MTLFDVAIYRVILTTGTQKETGLLIPFVAAILGTKLLTNLCLVRQNSAQLRTETGNITQMHLFSIWLGHKQKQHIWLGLGI